MSSWSEGLGGEQACHWRVRRAIDRTRPSPAHCHDGQFLLPLPQPFLKFKRHRQLIFSVFKTLTDQTVIVELKNDLLITGVLKSVDQSVS